MSEKPSRGWWFTLLAVVMAAASLGVSVAGLYLVGPQWKTVTTTNTVTSAVSVTTTLTTSVWWTVTSTTPVSPFASVLESHGTCGTLDEPELSYAKVGNYVFLVYREQANVPCYRHVIIDTKILERWPPIVDITLELERTSIVCVECIGVIETVLRVGPLEGPGGEPIFPDGTEIVVNGLRILVSG